MAGLTGSSAVLTGKPIKATGGVTRAVLGTALPTDATTKLNAAFTPLGLISEDGVTRTVDSSDEKIKAWGGSVVKVVRSDYSVSYSFTFLESANATVLKSIFGEDNVVVTTPDSGDVAGKVTITHNSTMVPRATYTLEMLDENTFIREVIPSGQLTVNGDVQFVHSNVISYTVTIEAMEDEAGNNAYEYQDTVKPAALSKYKNALTGV